MKAKAKYFVWTLPMCLILILSALILTLQSCKVPVYIDGGKRFVSLEDIYTPFIVYGLILLTGTISSLLTWVGINRISKRLEKLGHPI